MLPSKKSFKKETNLKKSIHQPKDEIDQALFDEQVADLKKIKLKDQMVRNFQVYFLLRYVLFIVSLTTLQHLHKFQVVVILGIQVIYFGIFGKLIIKKKIFNWWFPYVGFFVQESALTLFLIVTMAHQFNKNNISDSQLFYIEIIQLSGIFVAFAVELLAFLLVVVGMIV